MNPNLVWGVLLGLCGAYEAYGVYKADTGLTLSERIRAWFRVSTTTGKAVFVVAWLALTAWFIPHILLG